MKSIERLKDIIQGWKNLIFKDKHIEVIAAKRLKICKSCPNLKDGIIPKCGLCGCPVSAKVRSVKSPCPDNRW